MSEAAKSGESGAQGDGRPEADTRAFVVVGAGQAAGQLVARLRAEGFTGRVVLVGEEPHPPYQRPPLSKDYLAGRVDIDRVYLRPAGFYAEAGVELRPGRRVTAIDRDTRRLTLDDGETLAWDRLALTTGSRPRRLPVPGHDRPGVYCLRTIEDADVIREHLHPGARIVVVGGGYIGLEVAAVARTLEARVTVLEMAAQILARVASPETAAFLAREHAERGVDIHTGARVSAIEGPDAPDAQGAKTGVVVTAEGARFPADCVVIGIGIVPNVELAADAGLPVEDGIVVDESGATADPDIFAAGDCTRHPSALYGRRVRLESVHNAMAQSRVVAAAMCGKPARYDEVPWFWSDQYDLKLQIAGLGEGHDTRILRGRPEDRAYTLFMLKEGIVIAAETVNSLQDHMACRRLVQARARVEPERLADPSVPLKSLLG